MSEIRIIDLPESTSISDNDYFLLEQNDGTKRAKGLIINKKIKDVSDKVVENSSQLSDITKEVADARGDKENLNLKLVDLENRMTENIAKQYLEVATDTGHMKVENCYNGKTRDLVIKGNTLQNLQPPHTTICTSDVSYATTYPNYKLMKPNTKYTVIVFNKPSEVNSVYLQPTIEGTREIYSKNYAVFTTKNDILTGQHYIHAYTAPNPSQETIEKCKKMKFMILEGDKSEIVD